MSYSLCSLCKQWPVCDVTLDQAAEALAKCPKNDFIIHEHWPTVMKTVNKMEHAGYKVSLAGPNTKVET